MFNCISVRAISYFSTLYATNLLTKVCLFKKKSVMNRSVMNRSVLNDRYEQVCFERTPYYTPTTHLDHSKLMLLLSVTVKVMRNF